ncbi:H/ACA ribonucleoprotein complex subunit 2-like protein [Halotydeus destructor]|nr:H/ACA ribonucleoprotein complex subunit 2-like protein [Halotydeus destructor]
MVKVKKEKRDHDDSMTEEPSKKKSKSEIKDEADESTILEPGSVGDLALLPYNDKLQYVSIIANPMVGKKLAKKLFKLIKKASQQKTYLRSGLRDVQMRIRKGETGLVIFAGDVTPIEVMCHLPAVCEEKNLPYGYVPLRADISAAMGVKRPCLMTLVRHHADYDELYKECEAELKALPSAA